MKKAVLHILFLSLLLTTGKALAFVSPHEPAQEEVSSANQFVAKALLDNDATHYKNELLADTDDYDEYESDHIISVKEKAVSVLPTFFAATLLITFFSAKRFASVNYSNNNISRLPRYDFIALRVLRI